MELESYTVMDGAQILQDPSARLVALMGSFGALGWAGLSMFVACETG